MLLLDPSCSVITASLQLACYIINVNMPYDTSTNHYHVLSVACQCRTELADRTKTMYGFGLCEFLRHAGANLSDIAPDHFSTSAFPTNFLSYLLQSFN
jgi:hypothetical protein